MIVEGSVLREGSEARITAQLIDARTDQHIWARSYVRDLTSVLALQGEVARTIADEISIEMTPQETGAPCPGPHGRPGSAGVCICKPGND